MSEAGKAGIRILDLGEGKSEAKAINRDVEDKQDKSKSVSPQRLKGHKGSQRKANVGADSPICPLCVGARSQTRPL